MWRGVSLKKLSMLLLGPMLVETISTLLLSWMFLRAVSDGYPPRAQMLIPALGSAGYCISSFIAGRWITPRYAPWSMVASIVLAVGLGIAAVLADHFIAFIVISPMIGIMIGHYYVPFQINMSHVRPFHTMAWSVAFYNVAWGSGAAIGPMFGAWLEQRPGAAVAWLALGFCAAHTFLAFLAMTAPPPHSEVNPQAAFTSTHRQRMHAWLCFIAVGLVIRGMYGTLWPFLGKAHGWTAMEKGLGLMALYMPVALFAPVWARLRRRLDRPWLMFVTMGIGAAAMMRLPYIGSWTEGIVCAVGIGLMESCVVFHMIYYANADPHSRSRSVGISESLAGAVFVLGPVSMGLLAWDDDRSIRPYVFGAAVVVLMLLWVAFDERRTRSAPGKSAPQIVRDQH